MQTQNQREYKEYMEQIKEAVERKTGKQVTVQKVNKNNGLMLDGLTILSEEVNVSPTIYLNDFFEEYLTSGANTVAERIIAIYEENKPKEPIDVSFFTDVEKVRPQIKMKLVNYEKNKELLEQVPYVRFLDLAVLFIVALEPDCDNGFATILVHNHHLNFWNMDTEGLYSIAMENTANDFEIIPMSAIIKELVGIDSSDEIMESAEIEMSVLTTPAKMYGATGMVHKEILEKYKEERQAEKVIILPSSIHEVLLIPCDSSADMKYFRDMVKEVNATQVQPEEVLSNNVYVYDGDVITIAE